MGSNTVQLRKIIVGWVKQSATQQSTGNLGFRSSNATCFSQGETLREQVGKLQWRSGSPTYTG
ncbi:hypothetical protein H6G97_08200 [Nostoc flagelliforme FACHB-838]|uniref:Uncharacterized protein n=1 Tax=Nostoc flagelliforme FACHB-838 TaxID=2692904 RepID=A0ABR8DJH9_9NOSO|nr:hypothetical protein [Nostoc flagelliforme]MBD2529555.1 hypothetical protein [Nostoc flagelliforme FACHB-838]